MCIYVHLNEQAEEAHDQMHISEQLNATKHIKLKNFRNIFRGEGDGV